MAIIKIRQLIDMAINSREQNNINCSALHCLLLCITEKLGLTDEVVDYCHTESETIACSSKMLNYEVFQKSRLMGGYNPDVEESDNETLPKSDITHEPSDIDVTIEQNQTSNSVDQLEVIVSPVEDQADEAIEENSVEGHPSSKPSEVAVQNLKEGITQIETVVQNISSSKVLSSGVSVMKDQLEFLMEHVLILTFLILCKKPDHKQIQQLYSMAQTLLELKKENIYVKSFKQIQLPTSPPLDWQSVVLQLNETLSENDILEAHDIDSSHKSTEFQKSAQDELDFHPCYSPEKLLDQLLGMKGDFCSLTNKVNELSSHLLEHGNQHAFALIQNVQDQIQDIKLTAVTLKENQNRVELQVNNNQSNIKDTQNSIEQIFEEKVDKTQFDMQLANKVDYDQLQRKVSLDEILELQCRLEKKFGDLLERINENEKKLSDTIDNLKTNLGLSDVDKILNRFKSDITKDIQRLNDLFKNYIESTNDESTAAVTRSQVLKNVACLSCNANCVMRAKEKAKVAKLPNANTSNILSPLITYELSSIRKSGLMGYYRKDDFPHAPNAWLAQQTNDSVTNTDRCIPRYAGGRHTTNTAKERFDKISNTK